MFTNILYFIIIMICLIVPGFILRKLKMISDSGISSLVNILLYVCSPLLVLKSLLYDSSSKVNPTDKNFLFGMIIVFVVAILTMILMYFIAKPCMFAVKRDKKKRAYVFASMFGNVGFIGMPFLHYILKDSAILPYALVYASIYSVAFNILCWTLGIFIMSGSFKNTNWKKIVFNPVFVVTLIGLPLFLLKIDLSKLIPPAIEAVDYLATMTTPLSLIIVGAKLADANIRAMITDKFCYISTALRLIACPIITFIIMFALKKVGIFGSVDSEFYKTVGSAVCTTVILLSGLPTATSTIAFAEKFGASTSSSVNCFIISTGLTLISLPLIMPFLCSFF